MFYNGYVGKLMSERAKMAYQDGQKPLNKWNKDDIIKEVEYLKTIGLVNFDMNLFKRMSLETLKEKVLIYSSWHHTSNHFNETDFYCIDTDYVENLTDEKIEQLIQEQNKRKDKQKELGNFKYGIINVQVWGGTRKHPKLEGFEQQAGIVIGNWLYYHSPRGKLLKYKINANKTEWVQIFDTCDELIKEFPEYKNTKQKFNELIKIKVK